MDSSRLRLYCPWSSRLRSASLLVHCLHLFLSENQSCEVEYWPPLREHHRDLDLLACMQLHFQYCCCLLLYYRLMLENLCHLLWAGLHLHSEQNIQKIQATPVYKLWLEHKALVLADSKASDGPIVSACIADKLYSAAFDCAMTSCIWESSGMACKLSPSALFFQVPGSNTESQYFFLHSLQLHGRPIPTLGCLGYIF